MPVGRIIRFVLLCLVVGLIAAALGVGVEDFWRWVLETAEIVGAWLAAKAEWALPYILIGAGILVPIYLARYLWRWVRNRR